MTDNKGILPDGFKKRLSVAAAANVRLIGYLGG